MGIVVDIPNFITNFEYQLIWHVNYQFLIGVLKLVKNIFKNLSIKY